MNIKQIILSTTNKGKLEEFRNIIAKDKFIIKSIDEIFSGDFSVEENGISYEANAFIKAKHAALLTHEYCLADDSGIEIEALDNGPGLYSARYLKANSLQMILDKTKSNPNRKLRFVCSLVLVNPNAEQIFASTQYWEGLLSYQIKGFQGFGYDPIAIPNEYPSKTVAELAPEIKNSISHRAKAYNELKKFLSS